MLSNLATLGKHLEMVFVQHILLCFNRRCQGSSVAASRGCGRRWSRPLCPPSQSNSPLSGAGAASAGDGGSCRPAPEVPALSFKGWKDSGMLITIYFSPSNQVFSGIPAQSLRDKTPQIGPFSPRRSPIRAALRACSAPSIPASVLQELSVSAAILQVFLAHGAIRVTAPGPVRHHIVP